MEYMYIALAFPNIFLNLMKYNSTAKDKLRQYNYVS